ncbi:hypothetical protein GCG54_00012901 [Colletotrichum gloeosporioides]|uniref:Transmembrane protein n=1 Tax=Colletotrichum gloeosporioides TaxID=474922 RepID=A0A8H4FQM8_COLGL|nr:uncharacterized protein GCG54_00012901 [Colletotrichum gloeosporioides]KAF3809614.1 hypothetical protein GCG54_00012901 [Colletotrichum gloeosporioides]
MKTFLDEISSATFLALLERYGPSQPKHDAVLSKSLFRPKESGWFYIPLVVLWVLPIGLGVAYKSAIGGEVSRIIDPKAMDPSMALESDRLYGLFPLANESLTTSASNSPYLLTNATSDFFSTSAVDDNFYPSTAFPKPFGHNVLLLENNTAAALDLPRYPYIRAMQNRIKDGEGLIINATVQAYITRLNTTAGTLLANDRFWNDTIGKQDRGMTAYTQFANATALGMVPWIPNGDGTTSCLLGFYSPTQVRWFDYYNNTNDPREHAEIQAFRKSAMAFTTHRTKCTASWRVTRQSFHLQHGNCSAAAADMTPQSQIFFDIVHFSPFTLDTLPVIGLLLKEYPEWDIRAGSPWRMPSFVVALVGSYWARGVFMIQKLAPRSEYTDLMQSWKYHPSDETAELSRKILHPYWWLYLVLGILPFLTTAAFLANQLYLYPRSVVRGSGFHMLLGDTGSQATSFVNSSSQ